jgi:hypothetical protein
MAEKKDHPGSERHADEKRGRGTPRYHGGDWDKAERENEHAVSAATEDEDTEDRIDDAGTRGAVYGHGGVGKVEREADDAVEPEEKVASREANDEEVGSDRKRG